MSPIISSLFAIIYALFQKIQELSPEEDKDQDHSLQSPKYKKFTVDQPPKIKLVEKQDYKALIQREFDLFGKQVKPVNSRGSRQVDANVRCPYCDAPHEYLYDNNGGRGQLLCKVCHNRFSIQHSRVNPVRFYCPHCHHALVEKKQRKDFRILKCINDRCCFYKQNLASLSKQDRNEYDQHPHRFKLRYLYREFQTDFFAMELSSLPKGSASFQFRKFSPHILGLCLTYVVNLGLSFRETQRALLDIHGVRISHTMIANYVHTASAIVTPFVLDFDYRPTRLTAADETYVKVRGHKHYVWFVMDVVKKSILGWAVSSTRTLEPCMLALRRAFSHFQQFPPNGFHFIADGYPIYNLAHLQFALNGIPFPLTQVIGLSNEDPVSTQYRWLKQVMERLNRSFKRVYRHTNGYGSFEGADAHTAIFVAYYNFLRPHSYSYWQPLNHIPDLDKADNMPGRWQILIHLAQQHLLQKQADDPSSA